MDTEHYVYKKEVDWSLLYEGLAIPSEHQVIFGRNMKHFLSRGESKNVSLYLNGKRFSAKITNLNIGERHNHKTDLMQIRYPANGELAVALQGCFSSSYQYLSEKRKLREPGDRRFISLPESCREYLAIYTTSDEDTYLLEPIVCDDLFILNDVVRKYPERTFESSFNYDITDDLSTLFESERIVRIRKLNRKIGENLKLLYEYRCQICGKKIGEEYGSNVVEAHHIDYFVKSLNNDSKNQMIVCPNHHSIIHETNPDFDRKRKMFIYPNGLNEGLLLNLHLK